MSVDLTRTYLLPLDGLQQALDAIASITPRWVRAVTSTLKLSDGRSIRVPFDQENFTIRLAMDEEMEAFIERHGVEELAFKRTKYGQRIVYCRFEMGFSCDPPYAEIGFSPQGGRGIGFSLLVDVKPVTDLLDYAAGQGDPLAAYIVGMGEYYLVAPFYNKLPLSPDADDPYSQWTCHDIARYVTRHVQDRPEVG